MNNENLECIILHHRFLLSLQWVGLILANDTICTFIYFVTQNIFLRILLCPTVSPALQLHYVTAMFGNVNCTTLCSSVVLHSAYITGHWYI